jgi:hypothetical protein
MELLDPKRPCRRCNGTGIFHITSGPVPCASCTGTGNVPSVRDERRLNAESARRSRLLKAMNERIAERAGHRNSDLDFEVYQGYGLLDQNERHRMGALFDSLEAGRVDEVIDALVAYRSQHIKTEK